MRPNFLGDSYDIVKRFFCETLQSLGYKVYIDPMFTGDWAGEEKSFYQFLGVEPRSGMKSAPGLTALFLDPDTGVNEKGSESHVSFERLIKEAKDYTVVFAFDQAFSRAAEDGSKLQEKLRVINQLGCAAFYYASHAHFVFISQDQKHLDKLREKLQSMGLPESRLVFFFQN